MGRSTLFTHERKPHIRARPRSRFHLRDPPLALSPPSTEKAFPRLMPRGVVGEAGGRGAAGERLPCSSRHRPWSPELQGSVAARVAGTATAPHRRDLHLASWSFTLFWATLYSSKTQEDRLLISREACPHRPLRVHLLHFSALNVPASLASSDSDSSRPLCSAWDPFPPLWSRKCLQAEIQGDHRCYLICFASLKVHGLCAYCCLK